MQQYIRSLEQISKQIERLLEMMAQSGNAGKYLCTRVRCVRVRCVALRCMRMRVRVREHELGLKR